FDGGEGGLLDALRFSPDGRLIAVVSMQRPGLRLWDLDGGGGRRLDGAAPNGGEIRFSPDGGTVWAAASEQPVLEEWEVATGRRRARGGPAKMVLTLAVSTDGRRL